MKIEFIDWKKGKLKEIFLSDSKNDVRKDKNKYKMYNGVEY